MQCSFPHELLSLIHYGFDASTRKSALYKSFPILTTHVNVSKSPRLYRENITTWFKKNESNYFLMHNS